MAIEIDGFIDVLKIIHILDDYMPIHMKELTNVYRKNNKNKNR